MKMTPLEFLINAPEEVNPALSMCRKLQRLELSGELDSATMKEMGNWQRRGMDNQICTTSETRNKSIGIKALGSFTSNCVLRVEI